jgi:hypothetical protein
MIVYEAGFGLGALNDAEDDDVDVYDGDFRKQNTRSMAYDVSEGDDGERVVIGGKDGHRHKTGMVRISLSTITFR